MEIAKKRNFLNTNFSLPAGMKQVEYIEISSQKASQPWPYYSLKTPMHFMYGDIYTTFSFGPNASSSDLASDRQQFGASASSESFQEMGGACNREFIYYGAHRPYPIAGKYTELSYAVQKNVIYTAWSKSNEQQAGYIGSDGSSASITFQPRYDWSWDYKILFCSTPTYSGANGHCVLYTRVHNIVFNSHIQDHPSMNVIAVNYNGRPCFYDILNKNISYAVNGEQYFTCGPFV